MKTFLHFVRSNKSDLISIPTGRGIGWVRYSRAPRVHITMKKRNSQLLFRMHRAPLLAASGMLRHAIQWEFV